jgi:hypothetical protein
MANPYTQPTLSGYNSSPPPDDGTQVAANEIKWATHTGKIGDPLKTFAEAIDTNVLAAFATVFKTTENVFNDASADIDFRVESNNATHMFFVDAGNDNIVIDASATGLTSGDGTVHIHTASAGTVAAQTAANDLVIESGSDTGISILSPDASKGLLYFGTPTDNRGANLEWDYTNNLLTLETNKASSELAFGTASSVEAMRIDANQDLHLGGTSPSARFHCTDTARTAAYFESTDATASIGPILTLWRNSASPADNDLIGGIRFDGEDDADNETTYAQLDTTILDAGDGAGASEDGLFLIRTINAGSLAARVGVGQGLYTAGATGGDQGADTINASSYYVDGTVGADFGPGAVTSITVVKGIVTAIS